MINVIKDFPILSRRINGKRLVYLDNAATSQMPKPVMEAIIDLEYNHRANVHRGIHTLSEEASEMYETARETIANFIKADSKSEVVFVKNSTEAINTVAYSWGLKNLKKDDIVLLSSEGHHSNIVPWQEIQKLKKFKIVYLDTTKEGFLQLDKKNIDYSKVKLVAFTSVSNVLGVINDIKSIVKDIHKEVSKSYVSNKMDLSKINYPKILVDASQSVAHIPLEVKKYNIDFLTFSGHKMYGPMGIGVLYINKRVFNEVSTFLTGGGMINNVTKNVTTFQELPYRLEAGTPNVTGAIGLAAACDYISKIGFLSIRKHEMEIMKYLVEKLEESKNIAIYGTKELDKKIGLLSFIHKNIPSHDLATVLDQEGIAVRSGFHCVQIWHETNDIPATTRVSLSIINSKEDIEVLIQGIKRAEEIFKFN